MKRRISLDFSSDNTLGRFIFVIIITDESESQIFSRLEKHLLSLDRKIPLIDHDQCYRNFKIKKKIRRFELKAVYHFIDDKQLAQHAQQDAINLCSELENILEDSE